MPWWVTTACFTPALRFIRASRSARGAFSTRGAVVGADGFGFEREAEGYRKVPQVGTVTVGDDVEIGAHACIDRATLGATIVGDGTKLDNMVHIAHNCRIGRNVVIAAQTRPRGRREYW